MRTSQTRGVLLLWLCSLMACWVSFSGDGDAYSAAVAGARALGYHAWVLLSAALLVTPLKRVLAVLRRARGWTQASSSGLRRALGLSALASALLHAALGLSSSPLGIGAQLADTQLRFGAAALALLCLLGVTSFPRVVRWLHLLSWKELHRLAYVAWCSATLHGLLGPYAWTHGLATLALSVVALWLLRWLPRREHVSRG